MARPEKYTIEQFRSAIKESGGTVSRVLDIVGCSHSVFDDYRKKYPELRDLMRYYKARIVDAAELALMRKIQEGDIAAIIYTLKTQGRDRGWSERLEIAGVEDRPITILEMPVKAASVDDWVKMVNHEESVENGVSAKNGQNGAEAQKSLPAPKDP